MTLDPGYFDELYAASPDPWGFTSRWYEKRKYAVSLAMLPRERYADGFEPGCSIGVLSEQLAARCDHLLSCDIAAAAVASATRRTARLPHVRVQRRVLPRDWPDGDFDLIVFSEFLYYLGGNSLQEILDLAIGALRPGGTLLAVHWRHPVTEYPRSGDEVHDVLAAQPGLARLADHREADFRAEIYLRCDGEAVSVAAAAGLI
jgi:SAM-dependent methyltransferase